MVGACKHNNSLFRILFDAFGQILRHGFVPQEQRLTEVDKLRAAAAVGSVYPFYEISISLVHTACDPGWKIFELLLGQR